MERAMGIEPTAIHADSAALTHLTHPDFRSSEPSFAPKLRPTFSIETLSV
jgi:hypothetical protein